MPNPIGSTCPRCHGPMHRDPMNGVFNDYVCDDPHCAGRIYEKWSLEREQARAKALGIIELKRIKFACGHYGEVEVRLAANSQRQKCNSCQNEREKNYSRTYKRGKTRRHGKKPIGEETIDRIKKLRKNHTMLEIVDMVGVSLTTVGRYCRGIAYTKKKKADTIRRYQWAERKGEEGKRN